MLGADASPNRFLAETRLPATLERRLRGKTYRPWTERRSRSAVWSEIIAHHRRACPRLAVMHLLESALQSGPGQASVPEIPRVLVIMAPGGHLVDIGPHLPRIHTPLMLSGACYAGYFVFMSAAFVRGDLSVVYPISRGVGPALAAVGGYFVLHERLTAMGVAGIGLILLAVVVISAGSSRDESAKAASPVAGALFAVLVGVMIAIYGVSDKVGVGIVHPFIFLMFGIGVSLTILLPWQLWRYGTARMAAGWREEWRLYMGCAALDTSSYLLYLFALRLANTAYVTPLRSVSVILAAIAGVTLLKESQGPVRVGAAVVVVAGALLITTMG